MVPDAGSDSDSDSEHDGFVKVDLWKASSEPRPVLFKPTIPPKSTATPARALPNMALAAEDGRPEAKANASPESGPAASPAKRACGKDAGDSDGNSEGNSDDNSDDNSDSSCSDEEISDVLDETEIQLIEAMEDTRIAGAKNKGAATASQPLSPPSAPIASMGGTCAMSTMSLPRKPLQWVGLAQGAPAVRSSFTDSLKERFSASSRAGNGTVSVTRGNADTDSDISSSSDSLDEADGKGAAPAPANNAPVPVNCFEPDMAARFVPEGRVTPVPMSAAEASGTRSLAVAMSEKAEGPRPSADAQRSPVPGEEASDDEPHRSSSVPLSTVEFVAPGVARETAMSLLRRVLDIDGPTIQQKMVEFLLIDGVIASLIGFITHPQDSVYTPLRDTQTAPCSPSATADGKADHPPGHGPGQPRKHVPRADQKLPLGMLEEFEQRSQHRERLRRQRNRCVGLSEVDLRRGYNAMQMLMSRGDTTCAKQIMESKLSVIVPCLMAVFHKDSLGSFHHVCALLEYCFMLAPLRTTRLMLYQQHPSRWWSHSESVAKGRAPICDILPYLSEPCIQRLFLKAEFGMWTGRLMTSLNLHPNDAVVVSDELSRIGLGNVAKSLGPTSKDNAGASQAQIQLRNKSLQLVRNRFQQLNRGGFLGCMVELIEDPDPTISESVAEFLASMINDCSSFLGFNILFKPIHDSELPVRRLAQLIINSPSQRLTPQAKGAVRVLHVLLNKTSCQYGLRTRDAQSIRDYEMHPRGSQVLLQVGQAARAALESFLPGLLATVAGQQENTDLTSHSAYNRRASVESLQLPEYDETDPDLDADLTEAETSSDDSDDECSGSQIDLSRHPLFFGSSSEESSSDDSDDNSCKEADLRSSAAALLSATYPESLASGSISSSLSPSSTLSASPMAIASSTPENLIDIGISERLDAEDLGLLVSLPKPDVNRLNLLRICVEVLRESEDIDEIVGWVDLRVWRALSTWFLNHPHNNILHMSVYQTLSIVILEAVRLRKARRQQQGDVNIRAMYVPRELPKKVSGESVHGYAAKPHNIPAATGVSEGELGEHHSAEADGSGATQYAAKYRALRRRAAADRIRLEESSNCDNILTYLIEQHQWVDKLVRRAMSPNFDGAHGYISLILNTLRLAVQADRRRSTEAVSTKPRAPSVSASTRHPRPSSEPAKAHQDEGDSSEASAEDDRKPDTASGLAAEDVDGDDLLPDQAYHDPATRARLSEYPLYRLQRWEISLLYLSSFRLHLRALRKQASLMTQEIIEFRLEDQSQSATAADRNKRKQQRPVPFFSPQKVKPPQLLDNSEIKERQLQINVDLLLGNGKRAAAGPSSMSAGARGAVGRDKSGGRSQAVHAIDEVGVNIDSLYARMLGFTEDLVEPLAGDSGAHASTNKAIDPTSALQDASADAATDEESAGNDAPRSSRSAKTRKSVVSDNSKANNSRRKKSKPAGALGADSVSELFDEVAAPETAAGAAEAICSALAGERSASTGARPVSGARLRKKPATASGSVRRRRARLHHRTSNSSLGGTGGGGASSAQTAISGSSPQEASLASKVQSSSSKTPAASELVATLRSLELEQ
ncbi:hypothetical protein GGF46_003221 [Coemansia sp. RSA 552]|nr:hypothetical protein GGF46_003221 [Coemansia sp. RSA 552]